MRELKFHYHLKLTMSAPVTGQRFTLRCLPGSDQRQQVRQLQYAVEPCDYLSRSRDQWGNELLYGSRAAAHSCLETDVQGIVTAGLCDCLPGSTPARDSLFRYATPLTRADGGLTAFASGIPCSGSPLQQAEAIMDALHCTLHYQPDTTGIATTAAEAFSQGCGVCQDYSHIMLAILRSRGIPARYAAGMLLGEGKSHAWVEVLSGGSWYSFDPTNCCTVTDQHIKLSHGRDAGDCTINKGLFLGSCAHSAQVTVTVAEI